MWRCPRERTLPPRSLLSLDAQGHELKREPLKNAGGMVRAIVPPPANAQPAAARGPARAGRGRATGGDASGFSVYAVPTTLTGLTSGILSKSFSTPTFFGYGSMTDPKADPRTVRRMKILRLMDRWLSM